MLICTEICSNSILPATYSYVKNASACVFDFSWHGGPLRTLPTDDEKKKARWIFSPQTALALLGSVPLLSMADTKSSAKSRTPSLMRFGD